MSMAMIEFNEAEVALLKNQIASGATDGQLALFIQVCRQTGLNPFARQIYAVIRKEKQRDGSYEPKMAIQTSIDGYRLLAQRSGEYAGQDGPYWYNHHTKEWVDVWLENDPPVAAKVGVMRKGFAQPIYAVARFESYAVREYNQHTRKYDGELKNLWAKMPELMIAKTAEALALRRAFPAELSGIYTDAEMEQADVSAKAVAVATRPLAQTEEDKKKARLNNLFKSGKAKGLFSNKDDMALYISDDLQIEITADGIASLDEDQLLIVEQSVESFSELAQSA